MEDVDELCAKLGRSRDVDELCAKLGRSRDIILKLLSRGVPRVDIQLPKLHPRVFEGGYDSRPFDVERSDNCESEPLLQTVARSDTDRNGVWPRAEEVAVAIGSRQSSVEDDSFQMARRMETLACQAAERQISHSRLAAIGATAAASSLCIAAALQQEHLRPDDGLMSAAVCSAIANTAAPAGARRGRGSHCAPGQSRPPISSAIFCVLASVFSVSAAFASTAGLVCSWTACASAIFCVLAAVFSEVRAGTESLVEQARTDVMGPLEQLDKAIAELVSEQAPAIEQLRQLPEFSLSADDLPQPSSLSVPLKGCRKLLEAALSDARSSAASIMEDLVLESHLGRLATQRQAFSFHIVLLPLAASTAINVLAAVFSARWLARLADSAPGAERGGEEYELGAEDGPGRPSRSGWFVASLYLCLPLAMLTLCSLQLLALMMHWRKRKLCSMVNKALTVLQRDFSEHIDGAIRTTADHVFYEVFAEVRARAAEFFQQHEQHLCNLKVMAEERAGSGEVSIQDKALD